jgi:hypothetical protein
VAGAEVDLRKLHMDSAPADEGYENENASDCRC